MFSFIQDSSIVYLKRIAMNALMKKIVFVVSFFFICVTVNAQAILDQYIHEAYSNNLVLRGKKLALDKSLLAIKEARNLFLPTMWLETQYTLAKGGRTIDIPIGDLLNPVYTTLNQLTSSSSFPQVQNVKEQFLPNNFYDVRIKTTMPILNPDISINRNIKEQEVELKENEILNYMMSGHAILILEGALSIVKQNLKLNESLLRNGKGLPAYVTRAESEVMDVENQLLNARNSEKNAIAYFNFLLNKPLTTNIVQEETDLKPSQMQQLLAKENNVLLREEIKSFNTASKISENILKMNRSFSKPRLNAFVDMAAQGFDFRVNRNSLFYLGGVQLQIPIYSGKRNLMKIEQTQYDLQSLKLSTEQLQEQLQLAALQSLNNAQNAYNAYLTNLKKQESAAHYFKLLERGYTEGVNSFIEFLDARNQLTSAQLQLNISKYRFLAGLAEFERQTAGYQLQ